jgi:hypothetical protein
MAPHTRTIWWAKCIANALQCILQLYKCPPADANVRDGLEIKMAAG